MIGQSSGSLEDLMVILKAITVLVVGLLSFLAIRQVMRQMQAVKVRATSYTPRPQNRVRLRQDPRTGSYYPEN